MTRSPGGPPPPPARPLDVPVAVIGVVGDDLVGGELLAGHPIPDEATARTVAAELLNRGPDLVVIAVGADGNLFAWADGAVPPPLIEPDAIADTAGGGDAFVAALTWALDRGEDRVRAGQLATAAAGLVVRHPDGGPAHDAAAVEELASRLGADR